MFNSYNNPMRSFISFIENNFMDLYCESYYTDDNSKVQRILSTLFKPKDQESRFTLDPYPYIAFSIHLVVLHKSIEN